MMKKKTVSVLTSSLCLHFSIIILTALQLLHPCWVVPQVKMCSWLPHHVQTPSLTMTHHCILFSRPARSHSCEKHQRWFRCHSRISTLWTPVPHAQGSFICSCIILLFTQLKKLQHPANQCHKLTAHLLNNFFPPSCSVSGLSPTTISSSPFYYSIWITLFCYHEATHRIQGGKLHLPC